MNTRRVPKPQRHPKAKVRPKRGKGLSHTRKPPGPSRWDGYAVSPAEPQGESARRTRAEAKANVKAELEDRCMWPGCRRVGFEAAHGYSVGANPEQHADEDNILCLCPRHHRTGLLNVTNTPELQRAWKAITDLRQEYRQHKQAIPIEVIHNRLYEAWGEILRGASPELLPRYIRYLRLDPERVAKHLAG